MIRNNSICSNTTKLAVVIVFVFTLKLYSMRSSFPRINDCAEGTLKTTTALPRNLTEKEFLEKGFDPYQNLDIDEDAEINDEVTDKMKKVIDELRIQIKKETRGYKLPSFREIEDLIPEKGGTPMRSIVITTWRSGSTFIGGVLNSNPGTFHFSEPLTDYRTVQVRGEPLASPAVRALRSLLTCNYHVLERYLERSKGYTWLFTHNTRLWQHCVKHKDFCWLPQFLSPVCRLFPFQSMKVVHIRLRLVEQLLADPDVVRYEDMSLRPEKVIPDIFKFFGLQYHPEVQKFVKTHTTRTNSNKYSTFRNSTDVALSWRRKSQYSKVEELQRICKVAMSAWGYLPAYNASHQQTFNPLADLGV